MICGRVRCSQQTRSSAKPCMQKCLVDPETMLPLITGWKDRLSFLSWRASLLVDAYFMELIETGRPFPIPMMQPF